MSYLRPFVIFATPCSNAGIFTQLWEEIASTTSCRFCITFVAMHLVSSLHSLTWIKLSFKWFSWSFIGSWTTPWERILQFWGWSYTSNGRKQPLWMGSPVDFRYNMEATPSECRWKYPHVVGVGGGMGSTKGLLVTVYAYLPTWAWTLPPASSRRSLRSSSSCCSSTRCFSA